MKFSVFLTMAAMAFMDAAARITGPVSSLVASATTLSTFAIVMMLPTTATAEWRDLKDAVLVAHNNARACHSAQALQWDDPLATKAKTYANYLSDNCKFEHGDMNGDGQNLAMISRTGFTPNADDAFHIITDQFWKEVCKYDYNNPGFQMATGHFTQAAWRATNKVACAWSDRKTPSKCPGYSSMMNQYTFVCYYNPMGNMNGAETYKQEIFPAQCKAWYWIDCNH